VERLARVILQGRLPAALIVASLFLVSTFLPLLGGVLMLVAAAPAAVLAWHVGARAVAEVGALAALVIGLATQQWLAPVFWLAAFWAPVGIGGLVIRQGPYFAWVAVGTALAALAGLGAWVALVGADPEAIVRGWTTEVLRGWVEQRGLSPERTQQVMQELQVQVVPTVSLLLPGLVAAGVLLTWWINLLFGLRLASAAGPMPDLGGALRAFRAPDAAVWLTVGLGALAWLGAGGASGYWAANGLMVIALPFFAQGLAVVHSARLAFGLATGWLVVFYILLGLFVQLMLAVALLGLADVWADFRNKLKSE
jgi:uncharacterized protein YybS (DUF2232 family)